MEEIECPHCRGTGKLTSKKDGTINSQYDDIIIGDDNANILLGKAGDDVIAGGKGADFIYGGKGNDILKGGRGTILAQIILLKSWDAEFTKLGL